MKNDPKKITRKSGKKPHTLTARWQRVIDEAAEGQTSLRTLTDLLCFALDMPEWPGIVSAAASALGMIAIAQTMQEEREGDVDGRGEIARARIMTWLTSQTNERGEAWPIGLVSTCLRDGQGGWAAAFADRVDADDHYILRRLESFYLPRRAA